jgi:general stress protein 26
MSQLQLAPEILQVLRSYYTCEVTTVNRQGQPITWPCLPYFYEESGQIIFTASIAFPVKALNARRHPQVSLLYSDPSGSHLEHAPALLVQGDATVTEMVDYQDPRVIGLSRLSASRQPDSGNFSSSRLARKLFSWYLFQRLMIIVEPRRVQVWPAGDFQVLPQEGVVSYVE